MNFIGKLGIGILISASSIAAHAENINSAHVNMHRNLIAKQTNTGAVVKEANFLNFTEKEIETEAVVSDIDIFQEGWNSRSVNPFKEKDVPDMRVIDVTGYVSPVPGAVTSGYGYRPKFGRMHKGVDLRLKSNDTVVAAFEGKVRVVNYEAKGYGNYVIIRHPNGLETVYGHLNKHLVKEGQYVKAGQAIGLGGSTGRSTGPHLHFETRFMGYAINPAGIIDFENHCTHSNQYTFTKKTYTEAKKVSTANK